MSCACRKDIEQKLVKMTADKNPTATVKEAVLTGYSYLMNNQRGVSEKAHVAAEIKADFPVKRGGVKGKTIKTFVIATFCPFCGKKYDEVEA